MRYGHQLGPLACYRWLTRMKSDVMTTTFPNFCNNILLKEENVPSKMYFDELVLLVSGEDETKLKDRSFTRGRHIVTRLAQIHGPVMFVPSGRTRARDDVRLQKLGTKPAIKPSPFLFKHPPPRPPSPPPPPDHA